MNPWGITDAEAALMDALCEVGTVTEAAKVCGISFGCASSRVRNAALRMAGHKPHARLAVKVRPVPTIVACIRWAQFTTRHSGEEGSQP